MEARRVERAESFLREAVYRSRASQAAIGSLVPPTSGTTGNCGLGHKASVVLDLGERGRELFLDLWGDDIAPASLDQIRDVMRDWIERQDALDRKRNHFLKDFRGKHGFDRTKYDAERVSEYDAGLARVNDDENRARRSAAERLAEVH
jgi:hypothetical protein